MNENDTLRRALATWGLESQVRMLQEECGELIAAANRVDRAREGAVDFFLEEVADVEILIDQMRVVFGNDRINALRAFKLNRLKEKLDAVSR